MQQTTPDTLDLSRKLIRVLIKLNIFVGIFIAGMLVFSLIAQQFLMEALTGHAISKPAVLWAMRSMMIVGVLAAPLAHRLLTRLLEIVESVGDGKAFVSENAVRLQAIAWTLLALQLLHLAVGGIVAFLEAAGENFDIDWDFAFTPWLAILLLFVLARVFEQGVAMREELEGTV